MIVVKHLFCRSDKRGTGGQRASDARIRPRQIAPVVIIQPERHIVISHRDAAFKLIVERHIQPRVVRAQHAELAHFGEVHPRVLKALDVDGPAVAFEVFLDRLPPLLAVEFCVGAFRVAGNAGIISRDDLDTALPLAVVDDVVEEPALRLPSQKPAPSIESDSTQERIKPFLIMPLS